MGILLTIGLFVVGFGVLLGTFTVIGKFGEAGPVRASLILLVLDAIAVFAAPFYDIWLWFMVQALVTVIWFLFCPQDQLLVGGIAGPLVLLTGVCLSAVSAVGIVAGFVGWMGSAPIDSYGVGDEDRTTLIAVVVAGSIPITALAFGRRIKSRWLLGIARLEEIDQRAR